MERFFLLLLFVVTLTALQTTATFAAQELEGEKLVNVTKLKMFVEKLPDMPKIEAFNLVNGVPKRKSLIIGMYQKLWKFHRDIPPTPVYAYGTSRDTATVPGPTIEAVQGIDTHISWRNHLPPKHILPYDPTIPIPKSQNGIPTVVHLHGGIDEPESDGFSKSWFTKGFHQRGPTWTKKKYHYHNLQQPGNLWYHDHAMGLTRVNILAGLLGPYIIRNPALEGPLGLPSGLEFDRVLVVFDRSFRTDGSIYMNNTGNNPGVHPQWQPEYFGDAIIVNGKAWPYLTVRRRKYRFRIINASNARFFRFFFTNGLRFVHVASDSAYLEKPIMSNATLLGPSEIADVILDFSKSKSNTAILANDAPYPYPSGDPVNEDNGNVMKFIIKDESEHDTSRIPKVLMKYLPVELSSASHPRYVALYEYKSDIDEPTHLYINAKSFDDSATETPKVGSTEVWYIINLTEDNHPLHIHVGLFKVLEQTELVNEDEFKACMEKINDAVKCKIEKYSRGKKLKVEAHEKGWKNVYKMNPGYVTKILVRFAYVHSNESYPFDATAEPGYVYHCHILDHEDNVMMRPLKLLAE
jgi:FtsP/CotA-like multicopper oxidase with cupredoxin domain